jgi:hypothetical protein
MRLISSRVVEPIVRDASSSEAEQAAPFDLTTELGR